MKRSFPMRKLALSAALLLTTTLVTGCDSGPPASKEATTVQCGPAPNAQTKSTRKKPPKEVKNLQPQKPVQGYSGDK
jgi:hypothetical protein